MPESPARKKPYTRPSGERRGLLIINTGDGKGKTTAALGLAARAHGRGKSVRFFQFMKVGVAVSRHLVAIPSSGWGPWSRLSPGGQLVCGTAAWIFGSGLVVGVAALAAAMTHRLPELPPWMILAQMLVIGILLKPLLAWRMLRDEVDSVERALAAGLEEGRRRLSYLVSRDTRHRLPKLLRCW